MAGRTGALIACIALLVLLAALIITVTVRNGFDPLLAFSIVLLGYLGIAMLGALNNPPPEE